MTVKNQLVEILFSGGAHGNYLKYFIDRFSKKTPPIKKLPFTSNNTSHESIEWSGLVGASHYNESGVIFKNSNCPYILITISTDDLLFYERWSTIRIGDAQINTNNNYIEINKKFLECFRDFKPKMSKLYNLQVLEDTKIPRFVYRDYAKLNFLNTKEHTVIKNEAKYIKQATKETHLFPISSFWDKTLFFEEIDKINKKFDLKIDINNDAFEIYDMFKKGLEPFLTTKDRCSNIINSLKNKKDIDISGIDTVEQGYILAWIEMNYKFITICLGNSFFKTTREIIDWLNFYPQHYQAMNPNLPTFNGIPNPYYLHNLKK